MGGAYQATTATRTEPPPAAPRLSPIASPAMTARRTTESDVVRHLPPWSPRPLISAGSERRPSAKHHIGVPVREAQRLIQPDRRRVGFIDVQHDLEQALRAQVTQSAESERTAQAAAPLARIDADHIHLADRLLAMSRSAEEARARGEGRCRRG